MSEVVVSTFEIPGFQFDGVTSGELRRYYSREFLDSDGVVQMFGAFGSQEGFYESSAFTVSGGVATAAQFTTVSTSDAQDNAPSTILQSCEIVSSDGASLGTLYSGWQIPATTPTTFAALWNINRSKTFPIAPVTLVTQQQLIDYVQSVLGSRAYASESVLGNTYLDVNPVSPTLPIAVGTNSALLPSAGQLAALVGTSGTPSSTNPYVTHADPRLAVGVYNVKSPTYGALGDGTGATGGSINSASAALTVTGAAFVSGVAGMTIVVPGAGAAGVDLVTTILTRTDATHVTLAAAASTSVSGVEVLYGTNDTAAVQAALTAACAAASGSTSTAKSQNVGADVYFPPGVYLVTSLTLQPSGAGNNALFNFRVYGAGGATRIATISPTADVLTLKGDSSSALTNYNCVFKDLFFWPAVTRTAGFEIVVQRAYLTTITDIRFQLNWGLIQLGDVTATGATEGVYMERIKAFGFKYGLKTYQVISLWFHSANLSSYRLDATALWLDSYTEGCTFSAMDISNPRYTEPGNTGIALLLTHSNLALTQPRYLKFVGVMFDSHGTAMYAQAGQDVSFTDCFFHAVGTGVWTADVLCDGFSFVNCVVRGCGASGVLFEFGSRLGFIASRSVGNNVSGSGGSGLVVFSTASGVRVEGAFFTNTYGTGGSNDTGLWIKVGADNFIVTGNDTRGNATNNLLNDAGTSASKIVANNLT